MAKGNPPPRGGRGGAGFVPARPGGNTPSKTGNPSGGKRGNLPPKNKNNRRAYYGKESFMF
ncbi:hypothetical protein R80B4_03211 [Fibrobacteres bacterium R8-0-B4]